MDRDDLVIFVTELARRQRVRREVLEHGFADASRYLTLTRFRGALVHAARSAGLLKGRALDDVHAAVLVRKAAAAARGDLPSTGVLTALSDPALAETLEDLVDAFSPFAGGAETVADWLLEQDPGSKLHQMGVLYRAYRQACSAAGVADTRDTNAAVLALLEGDRERWPRLLAGLRGRLVFQALRWLNPFEEQLVAALKRRLGEDRVVLHSALPPAHAEKVEDQLAARVRTEVMMGEEPTWAGWAEDLGDALQVEDPHLALDSRDRISFSRSVGLYGEIEDAARRIRWEIDHKGVPPERIALVVRNLGEYADAVTHVFDRFGLPRFFRRGLPASSFPLVKTFLSLLQFPLNPARDRFGALLQAATLTWAGLGSAEERAEIAFDLQASGLGPRVTAETARRHLTRYYAGRQPPLEPRVAEARVRGVVENLNRLRGLAAPAPLARHAAQARVLAGDFGLASVPLPARVAGRRALDSVLQIVAAIEDAAGADEEPWIYADFVDLLERLLANATVSPGRLDESGVWILNPYDAAGLRFDVVVIAGLNEGVFPATYRQDALFTDGERTAVREAMSARGVDLPQWALPLSTVRIVQESVLFLISLGAARERLVFSYQACDTDGRERVPSDFFRSLWNLAGWPAQEEIALSEYDTWRIRALGRDSFLKRHAAAQAKTAPYQRMPMPGASYLATIPLPLCCAEDEARQRLAHVTEDAAVRPEADRALAAADPAPAGRPDPDPVSVALSARDGIAIERARERFFSTPPAERTGAEPYCGKLAGDHARDFATRWLNRHNEFSPTALEVLARCRYRFLLARMARLGALRTLEDAPDALDRGRIIHRILEHIYKALAGDTRPLAELDAGAARRFASLCKPRAWAARARKGWTLAAGRRPAGADVLALVRFDPAAAEQYLELGAAVADAHFAAAERAGQAVLLGDPGVWATEKPKIRQIVANYLRLDIDRAPEENRFPCLFELRFGRQPEGAREDIAALELKGTSGGVRVHGQVDRVDAFFDDKGALSGLLVLDYKSPGRGKMTKRQYAEEIAENLDCQLPVYGFVAQQYFFGRHDDPELNAVTHVLYHIQERDYAEMLKQFRTRQVGMDFDIHEGEERLTDLFVRRLMENIARLHEADFSVDPLDCTYCDFEHICRVDVNALEGGGQRETQVPGSA